MPNELNIRQAIGSPLYDSKRLPCCLVDSKLRFVFVNDAFCSVSGFTKEEIIGSSISLLLDNNLVKLAWDEFNHFLANKKNRTNSWFFYNKEKTKMEASVETTRINIDNRSYTLTIAVDITEQVVLEKKLFEAQELVRKTSLDYRISQSSLAAKDKEYHFLTESLPCIVWTANKDGYLNYMNSYGLSFFGRDPNTLYSWSWSDYIHPEEVKVAYNTWEQAFNTGNSINILNLLKNVYGEYKWFQVLVLPHKNDNGEIDSWIGIASDVHQLIETRKSLTFTNARLRSLIDASPIAIYSIDTNGIVKDFWNPAAEKVLGWKKEEVIGKFLPHVGDTYLSDFKNLINETIQKGQITKDVLRTTKNNKNVYLELTGGCIYDFNGSVSEILITAIDITELTKNKSLVEHSLEEKNTLLQEIHHRVKNNLAIVVSLLQLQVYRAKGKREKYSLTEAQNRVHSIAMVHELLYQSESFNSVDLETYYEKLLKTVSNNMNTGDQQIKLRFNVVVKELNINQAIPLGLLINELTTNSIKYAFPNHKDDAFISLDINREGNKINVNYSDNGIGFTLDDENHKPGLGMQIINSLLMQLDAKYELYSDSHFKLSLSFLEFDT